jgi:hypothetical protein
MYVCVFVYVCVYVYVCVCVCACVRACMSACVCSGSIRGDASAALLRKGGEGRGGKKASR